jgi:hypothetical protein
MGVLVAEYHFVTVWKYKAPVETIWPYILESEKWPTWWKGVVNVETLENGDENGIGKLQRLTWRSRLPYNLIFEGRTIRIIPLKEIEAIAKGELDGKGVWYLSQEGSITKVQYNWDIVTTKTWMNIMAPVARPFFAWNHDVIMGWGGEGLAKLLGTPLIKE